MKPASDIVVHAASSGGAEAVLDHLATAVRVRVEARRAAETRLGAFAFREEGVTSRREDPLVDDSADWRYFVTRSLAAVAEPEALAILEVLRGGGLPLATLGGLISPAERDRLATADRISGLAGAGLVGRELESDVVALTPLGEALLGLIDEISARARSDAR